MNSISIYIDSDPIPRGSDLTVEEFKRARTIRIWWGNKKRDSIVIERFQSIRELPNCEDLRCYDCELNKLPNLPQCKYLECSRNNSLLP